MGHKTKNPYKRSTFGFFTAVTKTTTGCFGFAILFVALGPVVIPGLALFYLMYLAVKWSVLLLIALVRLASTGSMRRATP